MRRFFVAVAAAILGGLLLAASFPPLDHLRPLAVAGPMLLALALRGLRARWAYPVAFVFGLAFFIPQIGWAGEYLGWLPWFALAAYQAVFVGLLGPAIVALRGLRLWPILAACAWVGMEALRSRYLFGGFPWGRLGFSQDAGPFTPYVAFGGIPLLSGMVALCGFLLADALLNWLDRHDRVGRGLAMRRIVVAALIPMIGALGWLAVPTRADSPTASIAVIQGNVPEAGLEFNARRRAVLDNHVKETLKLADQVAAGTRAQPVLVVWPENSSDIDPFVNADAAEEIQLAADTIDAPILVGAVVLGPGKNVRNMAVMWWPSKADPGSGEPAAGPGQTYVKRHPAPFAEYIPYRSFFRKITSMVDQVRADFLAGDRVGTFDIPGADSTGKAIRIGDVICFEVAYDDLVADTVDNGAELIVVQTNNATFGRTSESYQQFAMSRLRAVEHGRAVVSASTSGVSGIILPGGQVVAESALFEPAAYVIQVPVSTELTVATRLGRLPEWLMCAGAVLGIGWGLTRRRWSGSAPDQPDQPGGSAPVNGTAPVAGAVAEPGLAGAPR